MMQSTGRARYYIRISRNGRPEDIIFEGPDGLSREEIEQLGAAHLREAVPEIDFGTPVYHGLRQQPQPAPPPPPPQIETTGLRELFGDGDRGPPGFGDVLLSGGSLGDAFAAIPDAIEHQWDNLRPKLVGLVQGAASAGDKAANLAEGIYNNTIGPLFGHQSRSADDPAFERAASRLGEGDPTARNVGELAGTAFLTRRISNPFSQGAVSGAIESDADNAMDFATDVFTGGVGGHYGDRLLKGVTSAIYPRVSDGIRLLRERGVHLMPGDVIPWLRRVEDNMISRPFAGGSIIEGRRRSLADFSNVLPDEAVAPYNRIPGVNPVRISSEGRDAIREAGGQLNERRNQLVERMRRRAQPGHSARAEMQAIDESLRNLTVLESAAAAARRQRISPQQLLEAAKLANASGGGSMRALAQAGVDVLPASYPEMTGLSTISPLNPRFAQGVVEEALYNSGIQRLLTNAYLHPRPAYVRSIADTLERLPAPIFGAEGARSLRDLVANSSPVVGAGQVLDQILRPRDANSERAPPTAPSLFGPP